MAHLNVDAFNVNGDSALTLAGNAEIVTVLCDRLHPDLFARKSPNHPSQLEFYVNMARKNIDATERDKLRALLPYIRMRRTELQTAESIIEAAVNN